MNAPSTDSADGPVRRALAVVAHPYRWLESLTGDGPAAALLVLFALNAVDELGRQAFFVLAPDIADDFGVGMTGVIVPYALAFAAALGCSVYVATLADRHHRVRLALAGGLVFTFFSGGIGLSTGVWMLGFMSAGANIGKSIIEPAHNSLLADYFPVAVRPRVYSFHRAGNAVGAAIGGVTIGLVAARWGWRAPFLAFMPLTLALVLAGSRLQEPTRGRHEREMMGASGRATDLEEAPPSFAEAWRMCWQIDSLRRIYRTLPFLAPALIGFGLFASFLYNDVFEIDEIGRGVISSAAEPFQLLGLVVGARVGMRTFTERPARVFTLLARVMFVVSGAALVFAAAPNVWVAVGAQMVLAACLAFVLPGIFAALSLAIPPRARAMGFSMGAVFVLPGILIVPVISLINEAYGIRWGLASLVPVLLVAGLVIASAGELLERDIQQVWTGAAARSEVLAERRDGRSTLLLARGLDVSYGDLQVLFDVDLEVEEGQILALLGTNGAGKSTLLKSIAGLLPADKGSVIFDGRDNTYAPANEVAARGVVLVPGGQGVFPSLTVSENLRAASWIDRHDRELVATRTDAVLRLFGPLGDRLDEPAANLSGGQQQMLALAMAFLSRPRIMLIDELSLGLAPLVVEELLDIVRGFRDQGTTVVIVEQSVHVALTLADDAVFMEKGQVRFRGPTRDLLDRPDILRSVFLAGAAKGIDRERASSVSGPPATTRLPVRPGPTSPALELRGVTRRFGGICAVDDVSLRVEPGEIVGVIGPNGAGKTTVFDLISGHLRCGRGAVVLDGLDVTTMPPAARARRGLVRSFQDARLFPGLTVEQTLAVALDHLAEIRDPLQAALRLPGVFDDEERIATRVDELCDSFGLDRYRNSFVSELSTGTRRVVDLACVTASHPTLILLDEPSTGIAQREAEALAPMISGLRAQLEAAVLVIEHDMSLVTSVADRLVALDLGRVLADGPPEEVLADEQVVESYLGSTPATAFRSEVRE